MSVRMRVEVSPRSRLAGWGPLGGGFSQTEAQDIGAGGDDDKLVAGQGEGHGRGFHTDIGREAP